VRAGLALVAAAVAVVATATVGGALGDRGGSGSGSAALPPATGPTDGGTGTATTPGGAAAAEGRQPTGDAGLAPLGPPAGETDGALVTGVVGQLLQDAIAQGLVPAPRPGPDWEAIAVADPGPPASVAPATVTAEGFHVVPGTAAAGTGPTVTYTVEVEPVLGADLLAVAATVDEALHDPRSWVRDHRLERVEDPALARIRVVLASPATVDRLCAAAGLDTGGRFSCWTGTFAALNADRWAHGAADFDDLTTYRRYLVNHEVGHGLGHGHIDCPAVGTPAPVMMQQTMTTGACVPNGWPYPDAPVD
jgi:hypothetical protein